MIRFLTNNRIIHFLKKYGFFGPFHVLVWILRKYIFKHIGKKIIKPNTIIKLEKKPYKLFEELYSGNLDEEIYRILNDERKLLFYSMVDIQNSNDVKINWELNRLHFISILSLSSDNSTAFSYIQDFIERFDFNEVSKNSNAMEIAIMGINIVSTYQILKQSNEDLNKQMEIIIKKSLHYIFDNIEIGLKYSTNHYFFNLVGAIWLLENVVKTSFTIKIENYVLKKLESLLKQFLNDDGSLYEGSTYYHKYVTDSVLELLLINANPKRFKKLHKYSYKMYMFLCYSSYNNKLIGYGDNDSGRVLPLPTYFNYNSSDLTFTHLLANKLGYKINIKENNEIIGELNKSKKSSFGISKISSGHWFASIRCDLMNNKSVVKVVGSHSHNNQLEILTYFKDHAVLVSKGTYSYTSDNNNRLLNLITSSHNTLSIHNVEQDIVYNDWRYTERKSRGKILLLSNNEFIGNHKGFHNIGLEHQRKVEIVNDILIIEDVIVKSVDSDFTGEITMILHPSFYALNSQKDNCVITNDHIKLKVECANSSLIEIQKTFISPEYGQLVENQTIKIRFIIPNEKINIYMKIKIIPLD
ncbi:MAG: heparinase II/III family protein [Acholeplasma sp.]|nr:heparinase II/III family protein [Acholeplasma sp.]